MRGKDLAQSLEDELSLASKNFNQDHSFHMIYVGSDPVIDNYLSYKQDFAKRISVKTRLHRFPYDISQEALAQNVKDIADLGEPMIVQLPLPSSLATQDILDLVPPVLDVDVLSSEARALFASGKNPLIPPVTASIVEMVKHFEISLKGKNILVVGEGSLVGQPMMSWLDQHGYEYHKLNKEHTREQRSLLLKQADIIISGVGIPGLIQKDDVKPSVIIIDAGTSEAGKKIRGDVDPAVAERASLMTPVPGGIGPLTIALLYRNVLTSYSMLYD